MIKKITAFILSAVMTVTALCVPAAATTAADKRYDAKMAQLTELLEQDGNVKKLAESLKYAVAFVSVSDKKQQAVTVYAASKKLSTAVGKAFAKAKATGITPSWVKLDVVTGITEMSYSDFRTMYAKKAYGSMRNGIAFNDYFGRALLDSQINSNRFLSYETGELDLAKINTYFKANRKKVLDKIPEKLYLFRTHSYFTDGAAYRLTNDSYNAKGRREYPEDRSGLEALASNTSSYFSSICDKNGKFVYGYYPIDNEEIEGYNIVRHGGTVWNLILQYDMTRDESLVPVIESALDYLVDSICWKDKNTGFISSGSALNLGANGISLLAFTGYAEIFGSDKYNSVIKALANGVLYMQKKNGGFTHSILKSDFSVYKDFVVIFYDGEAMYGLLKTYGVLKDKKYLNAAKKAADYFIENKYEKEHSHWISYGFNELTKYAPEEKYFAFGLRNVDNSYLKKVCNTLTGSPTRAETLGAAFELYDRLIKSGIKCRELETFDKDLLIKAFEYRIDYGLNYFMFPEYAMYFKNPQTVLNSFAIREDFFRIRIDDIQHFMGGYYLYWKNYDRVMSLKNQ